MKIHPTQLFTLLFNKGDSDRLAQAVAKAEAQMMAAGEQDMWFFWKGHSLVLLGQLEEAIGILAKIRDQGMAARLDQSVQVARSKATGDSQYIVSFLENKVRTSEDPLDLFELCECYFETQNWPAIAAKAKTLVEKVGTAAALQLAAEASFRAGETKLCLELLEGRDHLFPSGQLPVGLRRMKVRCWTAEGQLHLALEEADKLVRETQDSADLLNFVSVKIESADLKGAATESRRLLDRTDIPPKEHLNLAHAFQLEDPAIAGAHLDKALASGDRSPEFAVQALELIFRLNREKMAPELQLALMKSAQAGGKIELASSAQLLEMLGARSERVKQAETLYREGRIPLHFLCEIINASLSGIYQAYFNPVAGSAQLPQGAPIYVRHGGRGVIEPPPRIERLYLDISALLIAAELDLLEVLESKLGPCFLPHHIIQALYQELNAAQQHQPSRVDEARVISDAINAQKLNVLIDGDSLSHHSTEEGPSPSWRRLLKAAQTAGGYLVDYLPTTYGFPPRPATLTSEETASIISSESVFHSLNTAGKLTAGELADLRSQGHWKDPREVQTLEVVPLGRTLYLHGNLAELFAGTGLLEKVCANFKVWIEADQKRDIDFRLSLEARRANLRVSLQGLLNKLQSGLGTKWQVLPLPSLEPEEARSPQSACILELTLAESVPGAFVWFDDRFLNGFAHCGSIPTTSSYDVLRSLHGSGFLDDSALFSRLFRLRSANFRYIPLETDEILHHLKLARIENDSVVESPELTTLRRYISACLLERESFQVSPVAEGLPNPAGEIAFAIKTIESVRTAIIRIWSDLDSNNLADVTARADWIMQNVWCDVGVVPWLLRQESNPESNPIVSGVLGPLYIQGVSLIGQARHRDKNTESPRMLYFKWLRERFASDEPTLKSTALALREVFISGKLEETRSPEEQRVFRLLSAGLIGDFPDTIRNSLDLPANVLSRYGMKRHRTLSVENRTFDTREFWRAANKAARGKRSQIKTADGNDLFSVEYNSENRGSPVLRMVQEGVNVDFAMSDPAFLLLSKKKDRRAALLSHPEWFDCEESKFHKQAIRLSELEDVPERMRQIEERREQSATWNYQQLRSRRDQGESIRLSNFAPPATIALLNHLRLSEPPTEETITAQLSESTKVLLKEVGFGETFRRMATLPIQLPNELIDVFGGLSEQEQLKWSEEEYEQLQSPIAKLHIAGLLFRTSPERAIDFIEKLLEGDGKVDLEALVAILFWTQRQLDRRDDTQGWSATGLLLMTWLHSGQIYEVLSPASPDDKIVDYFKKASPLTSFDLFRVRDQMTDDISVPRRIQWETLVLQALVAYTDEVSLSPETNDRLQQIVRELCFDSSGPKPLIRLELLTQPEWHRDSLGSFLRKDRANFFNRFLGSESAQLLSTEWITNLTRATITAVTEAPDKHSDEWNLLSRVLNTLPPPESLKEAMQALLLSDLIPDAETLKSPTLRVILYFLGQQPFDQDKVAPKMIEKLLLIAKEFSKMTLSTRETQSAALVLMESTNFIASNGSNPAARAGRFARHVKMLIEAWPGSAEPIWAVVSRFFSRVPPAIGLQLWPLVLMLRSIASQSPEQIVKTLPEDEEDVGTLS